MRALEHSPEGPSATPWTLTGDGVQRQEGEPLCCARCGHRVSDGRERTERLGRHEHGFMNPHGFSFRVGCFAAAPGCAAAGPATLEHTWFPGLAWRLALCAGCGEHLGWVYEGEGDRFWGLVLARIDPCGRGA